MYAAIDKNFEVIGIHDDINIIRDFVLYNSEKWNKEYEISRLKEKAWKKNEEAYSGKYLVQYADNYIPIEDLSLYKFFEDSDLKFQCNTAIDLLFKILEVKKLSNKKRKAIEVTISMIEEVKDQKEMVSPSEIEYVRKHIGNLHEEF